MGDMTGFLRVRRKEAGNRPVNERILDYSEIEQILNSEDRMLQASRCMDCGVPFCHWACPADNIVPEWNDLLFRGDWKGAYLRLTATNNFPELTGRICPAPCEHGCVLNIRGEAVTVRENEVAIAEKAFAEGWVKPRPPVSRTGREVAVIGSGPAGLAAADQLNRAGHTVTVFEKAGKAGGLLRYGIPDFKLAKATIDRRIDLMAAEGVIFKTGAEAGKDFTVPYLLETFDAVCLATGSRHPRDLKVKGRDLEGIYFALDFLTMQNMINDGIEPEEREVFSARGKKVLVIGGGDTGSDCVGTAIRQKAACVTQIEILPRPPAVRGEENPWPYHATVLRTTSSHEEGCERLWGVSTTGFAGHNGLVTCVETEEVEWTGENGRRIMMPVPGTHRTIEADMVLLALGFAHPVKEGLLSDLDVLFDERGNIKTSAFRVEGHKKVFAAGDAVTGASLVVKAIASGRAAAVSIDCYLMEEK